MATKKKPAARSKKSNSKYFLASRNNKIILISAVVLVAALAILIPVYQNNRAAAAEKNDFLAKHEQLKQIAAKISTTNKPDEQKMYQSCRYQSAKFEKGDLYCSVAVSVLYKNINSRQANQIKDDSYPLVSNDKPYNVFKKDGVEFPDIWDAQKDSLSQNITSIGLDSCGASYSYPYPTQDNKDLQVYLYCTSTANSEHFPLEK